MNFATKLERALTTISEMSTPQDMYHASLDNLHDSTAMQVAADALDELGGSERNQLASLLRQVTSPGHHDGVRIAARNLQNAIRSRAGVVLTGDTIIVVLERNNNRQLDLVIRFSTSSVTGTLREQTFGHGNDGFSSKTLGTATGLKEVLSHVPEDRRDDVALLIGAMAVLETVEGADLVAIYDEDGTLSNNASQVTKRALLVLSRARELASSVAYLSGNDNAIRMKRLEHVVSLCQDATAVTMNSGSEHDKKAVVARISHIIDGISHSRTAATRATIQPYADRLTAMVKRLETE